jgi:hypothetical protein
MNVKRNGEKSQWFVPDVASFLPGIVTSSLLIIYITTMGYFAAKFAPVNGMEKNMDSRTTLTIVQLGINKIMIKTIIDLVLNPIISLEFLDNSS